MNGLVIIILIALIIFFVYLHKYSEDSTSTGSSSRQTKTLIGFTHFEEFELKGAFDELTKGHLFNYAKKGNEIKLKHEPTNEFSKTAIQVFLDGCHIGYVPDEYGEELLPHVKTKYFAIISDIFYKGSFIDVYITIYYDEKNN